LLQDVYQLDGYAFDTNKRKLELSSTLSLARIAPLDFQRFRETGLLVFNTPMRLFDADFPGHYLRLIKRVRVSMIALVPSSTGVRATLSTSGISRVVVGGDTFVSTVIRRDPDEIAFVAAMNATGVFELDGQPELLLPFEGMGVDATWELRLPRPANPFDFSTIADVLVTFEYTAFDDPDYRSQVIKGLDSTLVAEQAFSLANDFADAWYELNNPDQSSTPMTVRFNTRGDDFLPNLLANTLAIEQVALYFVRADGSGFELTATLTFGSPAKGGAATSIDGMISTGRGNASTWVPMLGQPVAQSWTLALPNTDDVKQRFQNADVSDVLLVVSYSGRLPSWPN
jgi:hypothetical protein